MVVKQFCAFWITVLCFGYLANADTAILWTAKGSSHAVKWPGLILSLISTKSANTKWNATFADKLKRDLLLSYDKYSRPTEYNKATNVDLGFVLRYMDVDEVKSILTVHGWLKMMWQDDKLKWNPEDYGGMTNIHMADHEVWQPDITLYNGASGSNIDHYGNTHAIVYSSGSVLWVPPTQFPVYCTLDLKLWPFDTQKCAIQLGSWTYHAYAINITVNATSGFTKEYASVNQEWAVTKLETDRREKIYECCAEPYVSVFFNMTMKRRSPMFNSVVVTPATVLILMTLSSFWLPPTSGEKIILNGINAIVIVTYMMYFAEQLPVMAMNTPLVVSFYSSSLYLVAFSMIISVIVINMSSNKHTSSAPYFVKNLLDGWLGKILFLNCVNTAVTAKPRSDDTPFEEHNSADDHQMINGGKSSVQNEWILFATAIDRVLFFVYCLVFFIMFFAYSL